MVVVGDEPLLDEGRVIFRARLGLVHRALGSQQWIIEASGQISAQDDSLATRRAGVRGPRDHVRLFHVTAANGFMLATPIHREEFIWSVATHVTQSFDAPRDRAASLLKSDYQTDMIQFGNHAQLRQADGTRLASDGFALRVETRP
jgi:hypothetical protein